MSTKPIRRLLPAAVAIGLPAGAIMYSVLPSAAATAPAASGVYQLASAASGKCIDVAGASAANSALLMQSSCSGAATRTRWKVSADGRFTLANGNSGRCVDVPGASTSTGVQLQQYGCGDHDKTNQLWTASASSAAAGRYLIRSVATGLCISNRDGSTAGNNPIVQETCSDVSRMQWSFNQLSGPTPAPTTTANATVAKDGTGRYASVQAAIDAVPANNTTRRTITIKAGTYREIVTIPADKPFITLRGLGSSPSQTVIVDNHSSAGGYGTSGSATVFVNGRDFAATNLTISNDYGEGSQAVAANLNGDRAVFTDVRFLGNQDTLLINNHRSYIRNSYIEGTVDFIFGGGTTVIDGGTIHEKRTSGGPITASRTDPANAYGFLIYKSTISGTANNVTQLGRPWGPSAQVLFRESNLGATIRTAQPWTDMSGNSWRNARFLEYRNTGAGAGTNGNRPQLSDSQAANHTPQKYLAGTDGWNPL